MTKIFSLAAAIGLTGRQSLQQPMRAWELQRSLPANHSGRMGPSLDIQARLAMRLAT